MAEQFDLIVIGSGPAGYVAAIRAAQLGLKTACIDKRSTYGGTCLNVGCIPSKSLLQSTELLNQIKNEALHHGIETASIHVNFSQMMERKNQVVKSLVDGVEGLLKKNGVVSLHGTAEFVDAHHLNVIEEGQKKELTAKNFLIATGSETIALPILPFDEKQIVSSTGALSLKKIPKRLIVVGGGVIGVELASVYQRLGSQVIVIEMLDHLCQSLDVTLSKQLLKILTKQGIEFRLSTQVMTAVVQPEEVILTVENQGRLENLSAEVVLVAVGRRPFTDKLRLDQVGITVNSKGFIPVDNAFRTKQPHIFAVGDVIEGPMLAHRASAEAIAVVDSLKNLTSPVNYLAIPNVIYTYPEVASVGLSEQEAKANQMTFSIGTSAFKGNARARCMGEEEGLVKILGDQKTGRLIGMHIIGPHASEIIGEGMLAIEKKMTLEDIAQAPHAHPTLSEAVKEAALDALKKAIHA